MDIYNGLNKGGQFQNNLGQTPQLPTTTCPQGEYYDINKKMCVPFNSVAQPINKFSVAPVAANAAPVAANSLGNLGMPNPVTTPSTTSSPTGAGMDAGTPAPSGGTPTTSSTQPKTKTSSTAKKAGMFGGNILEDTVMTFEEEEESGSDKLKAEQAKTENWVRKMNQKYTGPTRALKENIGQNLLMAGAGAMGGPVTGAIGAGLAGANATQFLLREILPYLRDPSRVTDA